MAVQRRHDADDDIAVAAQPINVPAPARLNAEQREQRRAAVERILRLREQRPPLNMRADDLLHLSRTESEG